MTVALERGILFEDGRKIATYDGAEHVVHSPGKLDERLRRAIAKTVGSKAKYIWGKAGSANPATEAESGGARRGAPPDEAEPPRDPALGDKTPEWADWLRRRDPEAYEKRYQLHTKFPRI